MRKDIALYLLLIGAFASLFLDIKYEHREVLGEMWQGYIPLVAAGVAILACLLAFSSSKTALRISALLFLLIALVGFVGVYYHTQLRPYMFTRYFMELASGQRYRGLQRPTFAPLSFTGLGIVGLILVWPGFRWPTKREQPQENEGGTP